MLEQVDGQGHGQGQREEKIEGVELNKVEANGSEEMDEGANGGGQTSAWTLLPPLENPLVLANLFRFCPPDLLANSRLVCKQWLDLSLPFWRDSFTLRFSFWNGRISMVNGKYRIPLQEFLECEKNFGDNPNSTPYCHYLLYAFDYELPNAREIFGPFWETVGRNLTTLELSSGTKFVDAEDFRKVIFKECPNLQRLDVHCSFPFVRSSREVFKETDYKGPVHGEHLHLKSLSVCWNICPDVLVQRFPVSWLEIFSHFQSLTSLSFSAGGRFIEDVETENMLGGLALANRRNVRKFHFDKFDVNLEINRDVASFKKFVIFQQVRLPVHELSITVCPELDMAAVQGLLEFYSGQLHKLQVDGDYDWVDQMNVVTHGNPLWRFPLCQVELGALEELKISSVTLETMDFLQCTPNLKTLWITESARDPDDKKKSYHPTKMVFNSCKPDQENVGLLKLEELRMECEIGTNEEVISLTRWIPNVKKLTMVLNNQQFAIVCENWTGLEKLCVLGSYLTDEGVTGRLLEKPEMGVIHPNITNLQNLKKMKFWRIQLTQASVKYGFLHLPCLERLETYKGMGLGPELREALKEKNICLNDRDRQTRVN